MRNEPGRSTNSYKENWTVKRTISVLAGVAVLGVLGYLSSRLWAQAPGAAPRVSVALINNWNHFNVAVTMIVGEKCEKAA